MTSKPVCGELLILGKSAIRHTPASRAGKHQFRGNSRVARSLGRFGRLPILTLLHDPPAALRTKARLIGSGNERPPAPWTLQRTPMGQVLEHHRRKRSE